MQAVTSQKAVVQLVGKRQRIVGKRQRRRVSALCMAAVTAVLACCGVGVPSAGAATPTQVTLTLDYTYDGIHAPYFSALDQGYYKKAGVDVTIEPTGGSVDSMDDVASGKADIGVVSATTLLTGIAKGLPLKAVALVVPRNPEAMVVLKSSSIKSPSQLRGASIGATPGTTDDANASAFLAANHIPASSVRITAISASAKVPELLAGKIDVLFDFAQIFAGNLSKVRIIPWYKYGITVYGSTLAVNTTFLKQHPAAVKAVVNASMRGLSYTLGHPKSAAGYVEAVAKTGESYFYNELGILKPYWYTPAIAAAGFGKMTTAGWNKTQEFNIKYGTQAKKLPLSSVFTNAYLGTPVH